MSKVTVDPNEAPPGYIAVEARPGCGCVGCCFGQKGCVIKTFPCVPTKRKDEALVNYQPKPEEA